MKYIDLFAGIGGFRKALDNVGFECIYTSEIDRIPSDMYKILHGDEEISGDIMKIEAHEIPNHELMVGGITCQGFSQNGRKTGFKHETGNLFFEVTRIAEEKKPRYIMIENVVGLLTNDKKNTISIMMDELSKLGYGVDFTVYNSMDFGLPQQRRRVFIIGILGDFDESWEKTGTNLIDNIKDIIVEKKPNVKTLNFPFPEGKNKCNSLKNILEKNHGMPYLEFDEGFITKVGEHRYRVRDGKKIGYTEFDATPFETTIDYSFIRSKTRRGRVKQGVTKTLDQAVEVAVYDGTWFRRLTTKEAFRLQGFSDEAHDLLKEAGFSESQLYARPSRSVSIPIVEALGRAILKYDKQRDVQ